MMTTMRSALTRWCPKRNRPALIKLLVALLFVVICWNALALGSDRLHQFSLGQLRDEPSAETAGRRPLPLGHGRKIANVEQVYDLVKELQKSHPHEEIVQILARMNKGLTLRNNSLKAGMPSYFRWFEADDERHIYAPERPQMDFDDEGDDDDEEDEDEGAHPASLETAADRHLNGPNHQLKAAQRGADGQDEDQEWVQLAQMNRRQKNGGAHQGQPMSRSQDRLLESLDLDNRQRGGLERGQPRDQGAGQGGWQSQVQGGGTGRGQAGRRGGGQGNRQGGGLAGDGQLRGQRDRPRPKRPVDWNQGMRGRGAADPRQRRPFVGGGVGPMPQFQDYENMAGLVYLPEYIKKTRLPSANYNHNNTLSDQLPLNRPVPDKRAAECLNLHYETNLPNVTFIIPFYNEAPSLLLRTVHSIFERTRPELVDQVIVVDDCSSYPDLQAPFERYLSEMEHADKVLLLRNTERQGLIRTRQAGADVARGDILMFMDAHTEVTQGYLEPILQEILNDPKTLAQPMMIGIDSQRMTFAGPPKQMKIDKVRSTFSWGMGLTYLPPSEKDKKTPMTDAFTVPSLVGCVMAVHRDYFNNVLEGFDTDMDLWGAENMEVPFRYWLCGGRVITVPCSRVGHVFRKLPYIKENTEDQIGRNAMRVAEVWMGQHKALFYQTRKPMKINDEDRISIQKRLEYKERHQCRDFDWLLENIIPDVPVPRADSGYFGNVFVTGDDKRCLSLTSNKTLLVGMECGKVRQYITAYFTVTKEGFLQHVSSKTCIYPDRTGRMTLQECQNTRGTWLVEGDNPKLSRVVFRPKQDGKFCLTHVKQPVSFINLSGEKRQGSPVGLSTCNYAEKGRSNQMWTFTYRFNGKPITS